MHLSVVVGPMCSGKTARLLEALALARAPTRVLLIKHSLHRAGEAGLVVSRKGGLRRVADVVTDDLRAVALPPPSALPLLVAVDEAQFFGEGQLEHLLGRVASAAAAAHAPRPVHSLLVAGLDLDFRAQPFGGVLALAQRAFAQASSAPLASVTVERLTARCEFALGPSHACGAAAAFSQRLTTGGSATVVVGGSDVYAPACAKHHSAEPAHASDWGR